MGAKLSAFALAVAVGIALIWLWSYSQEVDSLTAELTEMDRAIESAIRQIATQEEQLDLKVKGAELTDTLKSKTEERDALKQEVTTLEEQRPKLEEALVQAILRVREISVGMEFPELALVNGTVLKNAKIQRVTEETVTIQHGEGVTNARAEDLPAELRDRVRLGEGVSKSAAAAAGPAVPAKDTSPMAVYKEKLKQHQKKVLDGRLALEKVSNELRALGVQAATAASEASAATSATQKFYTRTRRDQLQAQQAALQRSYENMKLELQRLEQSPPDAPPEE